MTQKWCVNLLQLQISRLLFSEIFLKNSSILDRNEMHLFILFGTFLPTLNILTVYLRGYSLLMQGREVYFLSKGRYILSCMKLGNQHSSKSSICCVQTAIKVIHH